MGPWKASVGDKLQTCRGVYIVYTSPWLQSVDYMCPMCQVTAAMFSGQDHVPEAISTLTQLAHVHIYLPWSQVPIWGLDIPLFVGFLRMAVKTTLINELISMQSAQWKHTATLMSHLYVEALIFVALPTTGPQEGRTFSQAFCVGLCCWNKRWRSSAVQLREPRWRWTMPAKQDLSSNPWKMTNSQV